MKYFTKKWYLNGCVDTPNIEDSSYYDMDTGIHDLKIVNAVKEKDCVTLFFETGDVWSEYSKLVFWEPEIVADENLNGAHCLADEIYILKDCIEYHLLIWSEHIQDYNNLGYFTLKAKKILFYTSDDAKKEGAPLCGHFLEIE